MIYFDNAATGGFKPESVKSAVRASIEACANPGRSGHQLSIACLERVYACRKALCDFLGGYSYDRTVFTKNCTEALNIAIFGVLNSGDKVVSTVAEHNSVLRPLERLSKLGTKVELVPLTDSGEINLPALAEASANAKAVIITLASNVTGIAPNISAVRSVIPEKTLLICDGAQACGHVEINVKHSGIDALAVAGHKGMLAIQGSGALLFSERINPNPVLYGGTGSESYSLDMPEFFPDRLESGTVCYPAIISLGEGVAYLKTHFHENKDKTLHLTKMLVEGLSEIEGVRLYSKVNPFGIVSFAINNVQSERAANILSEDYSICVRGGLHCAPLMHQALGSDGLIRASLSFNNTEREVQAFLTATKKISRQ